MQGIMSKKFKKKFKKLYKFYKNRLSVFHKSNLQFVSCLSYFITNLMMLRDMTILFTDYNDINSNSIITSISAAIAEYEYAHDCVHKYYNVSPNGCVVKKDQTKDSNEVAKDFYEEKQLHIKNFFTLVLANIDNWSEFYGNSI